MSEAATRKARVVGVGELAVGTVADRQLVTYALGACIGLTAYDPVARVGGLLHFVRPQPAPGADPRQLQLSSYATTGIPRLVRQLVELGAQQDRLLLCAAGGAQTVVAAGGGGVGGEAIGKRNHTMLRRVLWKMDLALRAEDTGGDAARTLMLDLEHGTVAVRTRSAETVLWPAGSAASSAMENRP